MIASKDCASLTGFAAPDCRKEAEKEEEEEEEKKEKEEEEEYVS